MTETTAIGVIHDLQKYRDAHFNPYTVWFDFWMTAWTMFLPTVKVEAKIYHFPTKKAPTS